MSGHQNGREGGNRKLSSGMNAFHGSYLRFAFGVNTFMANSRRGKLRGGFCSGGLQRWFRSYAFLRPLIKRSKKKKKRREDTKQVRERSEGKHKEREREKEKDLLARERKTSSNLIKQECIRLYLLNNL